MKNALSFAAVASLACTAALAQPTCSTGTLRGVYVGIHSGSTTVPTVMPGGPTLPPFTFEMVSRNTYDGRGGGSGTITANFFGIVSKGTISKISYTVNDDCTVKITQTISSPAVPGLLPAMSVSSQHEGIIRFDGEEVYLVSVAVNASGQGNVEQMARTVLKRVGPPWMQ